MSGPAARILIFAKAPVPGAVKTRLIPRLGPAGAATLAQEMLDYTCREALAVPAARVELCAAPAPDHPSWRGRHPVQVATTDQGSGDLGERLARAAKRTIESGELAILVGTDCPTLDATRLSTAIDALERADAFLYPTLDGGYALLGLRRFSPCLFEGIHWSTAAVAHQTLQRLEQLGWTYSMGETLRDIDEPADYDASQADNLTL